MTDILAEASRVNRVYLSEIESGKKPGSVEALKRIADALRFGLHIWFDEPPKSSG